MTRPYLGPTTVTAIVVLLGACGTPQKSSGGPPTSPSGITGITIAGPQCPVEIIGHRCPPRPVSVTISVADSSDHTVNTFTSAIDGRFRVHLPPGKYTLHTRLPNQPQLLTPVSATVAEGAYTTLRIKLDTGIR